MSDPIASVALDIGAQNKFAALLLIDEVFNISISGTWTGTVTLQRSFDDVNWVDVEAFTGNVERVGDDPEKAMYYRIGIKTGDYGSGTVTVRISQ